MKANLTSRAAAMLAAGALAALSLAPARAATQEKPKVGVEEQLGRIVSLDQLQFTDESGQKVSLRSLFDRPVVLTLVYFRCPGICSPLLNEVARAADAGELTPGKDYKIITVSFDPTEKQDVAARRREGMLAQMTNKKPAPDAWRFLIGQAKDIHMLADEVGFRYIPDRNGSDFIHPATVIFLSSEGKVVRYLNGMKMNPVEMELAVMDARTGRERSFMQAVQQICYTYDPATRQHSLRIDRIILAVSGAVALTLVVYIVRQSRLRRRSLQTSAGGGPAKEQTP